MTLSLDTAYRSFGGEVEASSTPTICRLPDSRRHQLSAIAHHAKALVLLTQKRFEEAIVEAERCLALSPSFVNAYGDLSIASSYLGRPQKAIEYADKAMRLSPRDPLLYVFQLQKGFALALLHQDEQAIEWLRRAVAGAPQWPLPPAVL